VRFWFSFHSFNKTQSNPQATLNSKSSREDPSVKTTLIPNVETTDEVEIALEQSNYSTNHFLIDTTHSNPHYTTLSAQESIQIHTVGILAELEDFDKKFYQEQRKSRCRIWEASAWSVGLARDISLKTGECGTGSGVRDRSGSRNKEHVFYNQLKIQTCKQIHNLWTHQHRDTFQARLVALKFQALTTHSELTERI